jgi:hypothetical protein
MQGADMARYRSSPSNQVPHLVTLVAAYGIRAALRPLLVRPDPSYVLLLRVREHDDLFLYEDAARTILKVGQEVDPEDNSTSAAWVADDLDMRPWSLVEKVKHVRRAVILLGMDKKPPNNITLLIDDEVVVGPPLARHFKMAARQLRSSPISDDDAAELATYPLRFIRLAMQRDRPVASVLGSLRKIKESAGEEAELHLVEGPSLETLSGYGAAKEWGLALAQDIADWRAGRIRWDDVDKGILLNGPPGSGKTTYASALANSCGVPLVAASAAQWQAAGHLGDLLKSMRKFFALAQKKSPCIAFIDEFDSFGDRATHGESDHHDYKRQVINGLLECLDPSGGRQGVVVVGATNNARAIDAALLRPGRLEKVIEIQLPDGETRKAILRHHLTPGGEDLYLDQLVSSTRGWSGADLAKLARDARRICRHRRGDVVTLNDLLEAMPTTILLSDEERYRVAVHEAGHALLGAMLQPGNLISVRVSTERSGSDQPIELGLTEFKEAFPKLPTERHYLDRITIILGGLTAEKVVLGEHSSGAGGHAHSDLATATALATAMERAFGFGASFVSDGEIDHAALARYRMYDSDLNAKVHRRLLKCFERAEDLLTTRKQTLIDVARALAAQLELDANRVLQIAGIVPDRGGPSDTDQG